MLPTAIYVQSFSRAYPASLIRFCRVPGAVFHTGWHRRHSAVVDAMLCDIVIAVNACRYYLPWLTAVLDADAVKTKNSREAASHPRVLHEGASHRQCHHESRWQPKSTASATMLLVLGELGCPPNRHGASGHAGHDCEVLSSW